MKSEIKKATIYGIVIIGIIEFVTQKYLIYTFTNIWSDIFSPNPGIDEIINSLINKHKIGILSNTNEMHFQYIKNK